MDSKGAFCHLRESHRSSTRVHVEVTGLGENSLIRDASTTNKNLYYDHVLRVQPSKTDLYI